MKGLVVRNSKRRKASREDKEFFLGSLLALPSMNSEVFAFPPTMIWGRHQDRPSQKLAGFSLGKKMKESNLLFFFLLFFFLAFLPSDRAR